MTPRLALGALLALVVVVACLAARRLRASGEPPEIARIADDVARMPPGPDRDALEEKLEIMRAGERVREAAPRVPPSTFSNQPTMEPRGGADPAHEGMFADHEIGSDFPHVYRAISTWHGTVSQADGWLSVQSGWRTADPTKGIIAVWWVGPRGTTWPAYFDPPPPAIGGLRTISVDDAVVTVADEKNRVFRLDARTGTWLPPP